MKVKVEMTPEEMIAAVKCYEELKAYRKTGYTPEHITELHDKHWDECRQIAHYDNDLNSNRGWIPCTNRYPDENVVVLAYTVNIDSQKIEIIVAYWNNEEGWCLNFDGENMADNYIDVTHWMPLPEPPAEEKTE